MADPVPEKAGNDAGHELQQADGRAVAAHTARPQFVRDEVCCERLANRAGMAEDEEPKFSAAVMSQICYDALGRGGRIPPSPPSWLGPAVGTPAAGPL
jgi:hypothetical protein